LLITVGVHNIGLEDSNHTLHSDTQKARAGELFR